jgi:hypothetical protein
MGRQPLPAAPGALSLTCLGSIWRRVVDHAPHNDPRVAEYVAFFKMNAARARILTVFLGLVPKASGLEPVGQDECAKTQAARYPAVAANAVKVVPQQRSATVTATGQFRSVA